MLDWLLIGTTVAVQLVCVYLLLTFSRTPPRRLLLSRLREIKYNAQSEHFRDQTKNKI